jgi:phosphoribosylanthranilate isomerase
MSVRVKICGVRSIEDARVAADAGADFIGLMFTDSPRRVSLEQAREVIAAFGGPDVERAEDATIETLEAALMRRRPLFVGVFGDEPAHEIEATARAVGVDIVQLSGRVAPSQATTVAGFPLIVACRPKKATDIDAVPRTALPHLDAAHETKLGGTGLRVDTAIAAACAQSRVVMLAGGLTPENVARAIEDVRPWGVDVSGGVETDGAKDHAKVRAFVAAAKAAGGVASRR